MIRLLLPASIPINPNVANELRIGSVPCLQLATPFQKLIPFNSMITFEKTPAFQERPVTAPPKLLTAQLTDTQAPDDYVGGFLAEDKDTIVTSGYYGADVFVKPVTGWLSTGIPTARLSQTLKPPHKPGQFITGTITADMIVLGGDWYGF